jgi:hypothetical protein
LTLAGFAVQEDARAYSPYPPTAGQHGRDLVASLYPGDGGAEGIDGAGGLEAQDRGRWQREHLRQVAAGS